jgi:DNA polymerase III epsilon subunit-like protein
VGLLDRLTGKPVVDAEFLVFDTETSGLPRGWNAPTDDVDNWPRLVQVGCVVCDTRFHPKRRYQAIVRPEGFEIEPGAARVHGITTKKALKHGVPVGEVLEAFDAELQNCATAIAHNLEFDEAVMTCEFIRAGIPHHFDENIGRYCTMRGTTPLCRLTPKVRGEYKWPTLSELHGLCTGKPHANAHDALSDVEAVIRCLRFMSKKKIISLSVRAADGE